MQPPELCAVTLEVTARSGAISHAGVAGPSTSPSAGPAQTFTPTLHDAASEGDLMSPGMELHEALYTTRAMRRVRPDPIPHDVQARILDAAVRAPSGGNQQNWRFLLLDDPAKKAALAPLYHHAMDELWKSIYKDQIAAAHANPDAPESIQVLKVQRSAQWLADHFEDVPLYLFPFSQHDPTGGSIYPAVWSAMLAARAEGVGSCLTALLQFFHPTETFEILEVPTDRGWVLSGTVSFGYPTGTWGVAARRPVHEVSYRNAWGAGIGFDISEPLWTGPTG